MIDYWCVQCAGVGGRSILPRECHLCIAQSLSSSLLGRARPRALLAYASCGAGPKRPVGRAEQNRTHEMSGLIGGEPALDLFMYVCIYVCMYGWMDRWMDVCMHFRMYVVCISICSGSGAELCTHNVLMHKLDLLESSGGKGWRWNRTILRGWHAAAGIQRPGE